MLLQSLKNLRKVYGISSTFMIQYRLKLAGMKKKKKKEENRKERKGKKRSSYQEISIEVTLRIYFGERKNKMRLNQNVEWRKMAPASRNLPLKL